MDYFQENHSLRNSFSQYDGSYHTYEAYCTECNETIDSSREAHNWTYDYRSYSSTEHRVDMTCRDCDYSTTDYENHRDSNGDGRCDDCSESLSVTVTWNAGANGGTVNGSSSVTTAVTSGGVASAPGYTPVKAGYTFKGWYTSASGGSLYNTVSVTSARTFYAQFNASSYTVTWNANGGTPASSTTSQTYGATLTLPTAPTRTGYTFAGWFTAASGGTQVTSSTTYNRTGTTTYYAHWTANSNTITWNASSNGGTVNGQSSVTTSVTTGSTATVPSYTPVKAGHTFKGWYTSASGGSLYNTVSISAARTFYAQFNVIAYTVTWNANGGTPSSSTTSQDYGAKLTLPTAPTRTGYAFAGWYTSASGGTQVTSSTTYSTAGATTYYAHWTANANTVTWNASSNGGTVNGQSSVTTAVNTGAKATAPSYTPVKAGHTFKGWYTSATGGNLYSTVTISAAQTFYAQFTANSYTATWNANGGTPASATTSPAYGAKLTLPTQPTRAGYAFAGWYTAASGGTQVTSVTTYNTAGNVTYYAHWTTNSYTVTWNMGDGKTETTEQEYGEKLVMPSGSPVKAGHTFLGWFTSEKGGTEVTENSTYIVYGYACNETALFLPMPVVLANRLTLLLTNARRTGTIRGLGPDGKAQVSVEYQGGSPNRIAAVVVSCQHDADKDMDELRREIIRHVIVPALRDLYPDPKTEVFINPSGRFVLGGFEADTGLTGRKLMADTYGGLAPHGGGALSGKDGSKVDRSGAYMARYIAKNIVAAGLAERCTVSLAYAIGRAEPVAVDINTHWTGKCPDKVLEQVVRAGFDLTPSGMIETLKLNDPIYAQFCNYGHFTHQDAPWEQTDCAAGLADACGLEKKCG